MDPRYSNSFLQSSDSQTGEGLQPNAALDRYGQQRQGLSYAYVQSEWLFSLEIETGKKITAHFTRQQIHNLVSLGAQTRVSIYVLHC